MKKWDTEISINYPMCIRVNFDIIKAWEGILLEMDTKLASYAEHNPPGTVSADFLELLMFGTPTPQLRQFLLHEMTEKGLKKLGHSIELSYSNIQRLVLKYLHAVSQSINFHLGEMVGLTRANHRSVRSGPGYTAHHHFIRLDRIRLDD